LSQFLNVNEIWYERYAIESIHDLVIFFFKFGNKNMPTLRTLERENKALFLSNVCLKHVDARHALGSQL
jgi:hypothetical protein